MDTSKNEEIVKKICKFSKVVGDGICDDNANVFECDFDGGDCCGIGTIMDICLKCQCFSKNFKSPNNLACTTPIYFAEKVRPM